MKVPAGYWAASIIRPSNWASRWLLSLWTVSMGTLKVAAVTVVPLITMCPETDVVRPTAVAFCPSSTSLTRYPTIEPDPMVQVPATDPPTAAVLAVGVLVPGAVALADGSDSAAGVLPLKKWMYTNGPATARTAMTTTAPISHLTQWRDLTRDMSKESSRKLCHPSEVPASPR